MEILLGRSPSNKGEPLASVKSAFTLLMGIVAWLSLVTSGSTNLFLPKSVASTNGSEIFFDCAPSANTLVPNNKRSIKSMNVLIAEEMPIYMPSIDITIIFSARFGCFISHHLGYSNFKSLHKVPSKYRRGDKPLDETIRILD